MGVLVTGASKNTVGGTTASSANTIIANNEGVVVDSSSEPASGNVVQGNHIGVLANGSATDSRGNPTGNVASGVRIEDSANNTVTGNVISDTNPKEFQVYSTDVISYIPSAVVVDSPASSGNQIVNNKIGTNPAGTAAVKNHGVGITISDGTYRNTIAGNVISGTASIPGIGGMIDGFGVFLRDEVSGSTIAMLDGSPALNVIRGNLIGTDATGEKALGNDSDGIFLDNARNNTIGGTGGSDGNVISGNGGDGIYVQNALSSGTTILRGTG